MTLAMETVRETVGTPCSIKIEQNICEIAISRKVHLLYIETSWNIIGKENNDIDKVICRAQRILNMNTSRGRLKASTVTLRGGLRPSRFTMAF